MILGLVLGPSTTQTMGAASSATQARVEQAAAADHGARRLALGPNGFTPVLEPTDPTAPTAPAPAATATTSTPDPTTTATTVAPAPTTTATTVAPAPATTATTGATTTTTTNGGAPNGAAAAMPVGDLPGWRQIFTDDFATAVPLGSFPATVSAKWGAYPSPWKDTSTFGIYSPTKVVSVANGILTKHIHTDNGVPRVAALLPRLPGTAQNGITYGRFAARFRADSLPGYKVAWLLWPDSDDHWADGEIDFPETNLDKSSTWAFVHRTGSLGRDDQASFNVPIDLRGWHNVVIEWSPNLVVFRLDGVEVGRTAERVPTTAMHWVLQTETAMDITSAPSPSVSGDVQLDWVAAWVYDPSTADTTAPEVTIQAPAPSAVVAGAVPLVATATDAKGVLGVQFKVDGANLGPEDTSAPFEASWNTFLMNNGPHTITAVARDDSGNVGTSEARAVTVSNIADSTPPGFTTTPCLVGCTVFPQDRANVIAVFNENVVGVSATSFTLQNMNTGAPVPAVVAYAVSTDAATATLDPSVVLEADTKYTATLTSAITDTTGNPIATTTWTFLTGPRPTVAVSPSNGATGVGRGAGVTASFSEAVTGVSSNFTLRTASGTAVPAMVDYQATTRVATLVPSAPLLANTQYTVSLTNAIKDIAGNAINPLTWSFTTGS